ncbi:MAG: MarR family winged helix-turn-helix transcriptional regulator [Actinomycetota bacterium]
MTDDDPIRWLDADERQAWLALAALVIRLPQALDRQLRQDAGISHFEYMVLVVLSETPDRTQRMSTLAAVSGGSLPRLSQVVRRFEDQGWVRRTPDPDDGRYTLATLTDEGFAAIADAAPGHVETVRHLVFDAIGPDRVAGLRDVAQCILTAIDPDAPLPGSADAGWGPTT